MDLKKLKKLKRELTDMRRSPQKCAALESLAKRLGRKEVKRGKEHVWESIEFEIYPLSIPHHGGKDISPGTQRNMLNFLEDYDIAEWEKKLGESEDEGSDDESS